MKRVAVIAMVLSGLVTATSAQAASFAGPEYVALHIAEAYWGGRPPLCRPLTKETVPESWFASFLAKRGEPLTAGEVVVGQATETKGARTPCELTILESLEWPELCVTMIHEVGHLWGMPHSTDPSNVMYPNAGPSTTPICTEPAVDPGPAPPLQR